MIRINLRGKLAVGRNRLYASKAKGKTKSVSNSVPMQTGQGFKSLPNKANKFTIEPNKKLDKFINFKL
jgi:hypothetical protein